MIMQLHKPPYILNELKIEVIYTCPLACIHCSSDSTPSSEVLIEPTKLNEIVNQAVSIGVKEIAFSGGEPLLHPTIENAIATASKHNIKTILYTSGNVDNFDIIIKKLIKVGLSKAIFSLYADNPYSHEMITRIGGSFQKTLSAIKMCVSLKLPTEIHFVALKRTYQCLTNVAKLAKTLGINKLSVLRFVPQGRGYLLNKDILNNTQYNDLKKTIESLRDAGFDIRTGSPFNFLLLSNNPKCNSAIDRLIISPDLYIYPCDAFKRISAAEIIGNQKFSRLDDNNDLKSCWNHSPYLNAIREYLSSPFAKPCDECDWLESCLSGCLAQKVLAASGQLLKKPDPNCMRIFYEKEYVH